jgi:hypothetical protein
LTQTASLVNSATGGPSACGGEHSQCRSVTLIVLQEEPVHVVESLTVELAVVQPGESSVVLCYHRNGVYLFVNSTVLVNAEQHSVCEC